MSESIDQIEHRSTPRSEASISEQEIQAARQSARRVMLGILALMFLYLALWGLGVIPSAHAEEAPHPPSGVVEELQGAPAEGETQGYLPPLYWSAPFVALLLCIALLPLIPATEHWWHANRNRFLVASVLGMVTLAYYGLIHPGGVPNHFTHSPSSSPGWDTVFAVFSNGIFAEFVPFIVLLFSLYVISGGISLKGDLAAHPLTNTAFLAVGTTFASFIGTTGAAMVLIRPLLATNAERRHKRHTVIFFIFLVCNCGGLLLPIGDPPLFLGYLRGVPFTWTLRLWPYWLALNGTLLLIYYLWDRHAYAREELPDIRRDETQIRPLRLHGTLNLLFLAGVVFSVATIIPGKHFLGTDFVPPVFFRELIMLALVVFSLALSPAENRIYNRFDYHAIAEVAALFSGIFVCMQVPIEILHVEGASLGLDSPAKYFWATGILSSFLDNAPTYVVFFETASAVSQPGSPGLLALGGGRFILEQFLVPISLGSVFMGANTYIGNGPNFMVKSIAEHAGIRMPSFFGYMIYSVLILLPLFLVLTFFL